MSKELQKLKLAKAKAWNILTQRAWTDLAFFHEMIHPHLSGAPYVDALHLRAIAYQLMQVFYGHTRRLLISVPPRHYKSSLASVAFPAFLLGHDPRLQIVCASYGEDLAKPLALGTLTIMQTPTYARVFPDTKLAAANPALDFIRTTQNGYRRATSVGGPITGMGADVVIVDDPIKALEAHSAAERERVFTWMTQSMIPRIDKPAEGRFVVVMQRLHQADLIGRLKGDPRWSVLELPAETTQPYDLRVGHKKVVRMEPGSVLFPEVYPRAQLDELRRSMGEQAYSAQYLQRPMPAGGLIFRLDKATRFDIPPRETWMKVYDRVLLSVDAACVASENADYTATTWWGFKGRELHLLRATRGRWPADELYQHLRRARSLISGLLIETGGNGRAIYQLLEADDCRNLWAYNPVSGKRVRANYANLLIQNGDIRLPHAASWLDEFENELAAFPQGDYDDYVDSVSQVAANIGALRARLGLPYVKYDGAKL